MSLRTTQWVDLTRPGTPLAMRYLAALAADGVALLVSLVLWSTVPGGGFVLPIFLIAVALTASRAGYGPAVFATVLATGAIEYFFELPYYSFVISGPGPVVNLSFFCLAALLVAYLTDRLGSARRRMEESVAQSGPYSRSNEPGGSEEGDRGELAAGADPVFRALSAALPHLIWRTTADGWLDLCNRDWSAYTGLSLAQSAGWGWLAAVHPDDVAASLERWRASIATSDPFDIEHRLRRAADGSYRWFRARAVPFRDDESTISRWYCISTDITAWRDAESERAGLIEREAAARVEAERSAQLIAEQAARLHVLAETSRALAASYLELPLVLETIVRRVGEAIGDSCVLFLRGDDPGALELAAAYHPDPLAVEMMRTMYAREPQRADEGMVGRVLASGMPLRIEQIDPQQRQTPVKPAYAEFRTRYPFFSILVTPLRARGHTIGALRLVRHRPGADYSAIDQSFLEDLADRAALAIESARLYQAACEAIETRDRFLSIAAHELRTPLTTVKGNAQLALRARELERDEPRRIDRSLEAIERGADRLAALINDLLDVSRIRTGQLRLQARPVDLATLLRSQVARWREQLGEPDRLRLTIAEPIGRALLDPDRFEQVLSNLIENAVKYSPGGQPVAIALEREGDRLAIEIADGGIGLPPGSEEKIFQPFGRADNAAERNIPGLGLGLYISRSIVEQHGGTLTAASEGEDRGTIFRLELPAGDTDDTASASHGAAPDQSLPATTPTSS